MPWKLTQRRTLMPMAAILSSAGRRRRLSGRRTQTPTRSSRRSPRTLKRSSVRDDPVFQRRDEGAHVRAARALQVEHDVGHALAGAVIGELPAAPGCGDRETRARSGRPPWREVPAV